MNLGLPEIIPLVLLVLLLFGSTRLPKLARSIREARDEFAKGNAEGSPSGSKAAPADVPASPPTEREMEQFRAWQAQQKQSSEPEKTS